MLIGIDFDGTLAIADNFVSPDVIGAPDNRFVDLLKKLHEAGHTLCTWTCRADYVVKKYLDTHDLTQYFSYINESPNVTDSVKANFDLLIDDRVFRWNGENEELILAYVAAFGHETIIIHRDPEFSDKAPVPYLAGTGRMYLEMFEEHWRDAWLKKDWVPRERIALLTICSHAKPYSKSFIHASIRQALHHANFIDLVDYIHISNAGIIPSGAEMTYPFNAYDHNGAEMTPAVAEYFEQLTHDRLMHWARQFGSYYDGFVVYLRNGKTMRAAQRALGHLHNIEFVAAKVHEDLPFARLPDVDDCLAMDDNLEDLMTALGNVDSYEGDDDQDDADEGDDDSENDDENE